LLRYQLEEQKREKERQLKREREREAKLKEMERREEEQRQALLYGPKRAKDAASRHPGSSSASKRTSDVDSDADAGLVLTREEKRERRLQLQFSQTTSRRAGSFAGTSRAGRRLPGGALNMTAPSSSQSTGGSANDSKSVRARLAAMPNTLTKLNTVKRDTRTIDEILRDRAKARENKTLEGEEAREFHDWFGTKTKSAPATKASPPSSPAASGASTPTAFPQRHDMVSSTTKKSLSPHPPVTTTPNLLSLRPTPKTAPKTSSLGTKHPRPSLNTKTTPGSSKPPPNKRPRSPPERYDGSDFDSESDQRPHKRTAGASNGIQDEIWKIFGRDRSQYVSRNVMSDDEDMEADMTALEREELTRCVAHLARNLLAELICHLAFGSPRRRTSRQNWKSVVTRRKNAAVARNEGTMIDYPSATSFVCYTIIFRVSLIPRLCQSWAL
jgi:protein SPT2